jgi:hypothetical protein
VKQLEEPLVVGLAQGGNLCKSSLKITLPKIVREILIETIYHRNSGNGRGLKNKKKRYDPLYLDTTTIIVYLRLNICS